jgi:hypothetical protein
MVVVVDKWSQFRCNYLSFEYTSKSTGVHNYLKLNNDSKVLCKDEILSKKDHFFLSLASELRKLRTYKTIIFSIQSPDDQKNNLKN